MAYQDTTFYALLGMLANVGLTKNDVSAQAVGPANVWKLFVARKVQAMAAVPDWIGHAVHAGAKVKVIPANAYFPSMAQAIIASDAAIAAQPSQIERLVRATLKGVRDIMDDPRSAAQAYIAAVPQHVGQDDVITQIFELFNRYVYGGQKTLGLMDERRLATLAEFYLKSGITERPVAIDQLFTNQFIR
jgi:NitT/TauT family transport system substrate-binding protein